MAQSNITDTKILVAKFISIGFFSMISIMFVLPYILGLPPDEYVENIKAYVSSMTFILGFVFGWLFKGGDKTE